MIPDQKTTILFFNPVIPLFNWPDVYILPIPYQIDSQLPYNNIK